MWRVLGWLVLGWCPLWGMLVILGRARPSRAIVLGIGLAGFVGGMCAVELRRHGLLGELPESVSLPVLGIPISELFRYASCGFSGALLAELLLKRWPAPGDKRASGNSRRPDPARDSKST